MSNNENNFPVYFDGSFNVEFSEELTIASGEATKRRTTSVDDLTSCRHLLGANPYEYCHIP